MTINVHKITCFRGQFSSFILSFKSNLIAKWNGPLDLTLYCAFREGRSDAPIANPCSTALKFMTIGAGEASAFFGCPSPAPGPAWFRVMYSFNSECFEGC